MNHSHRRPAHPPIRFYRTYRTYRTRVLALAPAFTLALALVPGAACIDRPIAAVIPRSQSAFVERVEVDAVDKVDLLVAVDNSGSMAQNQANIARQLQPLIEALTRPTVGPAVRDLHVGVISTDLGAPGNPHGICTAGGREGDHARLQPIANGPATLAHRPADTGERAECEGVAYEPFLSFQAGVTDVAAFTRQFRCSALLGTQGCGLEQPLEAVYRALVHHRAGDSADSGQLHAGFLRDDALLAIVVLTDEEDGSVRDCQYALPGDPSGCDDATGVYNTSDPRWPARSLDLRFYRYTPYGHDDPTWPLERYLDPSNPMGGLLALTPGHPERIVFAAIAGLPLEVPHRSDDGTVDWDALLGTPDPANPDRFERRDSSTAVRGATAEGTYSMQHDDRAPDCIDQPRQVPACRRAIEGRNPSCLPEDQYQANPSRRVVEIARRFDTMTLCAGQPCRNGLVASVCGTDYADAVRAIATRISDGIGARCLPRSLVTTVDEATGGQRVDCLVREVLPAGIACEEIPGRTPLRDAQGTVVTETIDGTERSVCNVSQVPTGPDGRPVMDGEGWFYERVVGDERCAQRVAFTDTARPRNGASVRLECVQPVSEGGGRTH